MPLLRPAAAFALLLFASCSSTPDSDAVMEDMLPEPTLGDAPAKPAAPQTMPDTGLTPVGGRTGKFLIRDQTGNPRVEGQLKDGRMDGEWKYYDASGRKLAVVHYRADVRHGEVSLFFVTADGKAAGKKRMEGHYEDGTLTSFIRNWNTSGNKILEREFDRGILQGARGWDTDNQPMTDGEAMAAGIRESREEDALLSELESFVQLQIRKQAGESATPDAPAS